MSVRRAATAATLVLAGLVAATAPTQADAGTTSWSMRSAGSDPVGGGADVTLAPGDLVVTGGPSHVQVTAGSWSADFDADNGGRLDPGTSGAGLAVASGAHTCSTVTGSFDVVEAAYDDQGALTALSVSFEQRCDGSPDALFGSIAWQAQDGAAPLPPRVTIGLSQQRFAYGASVDLVIERDGEPGDLPIDVVLDDGSLGVQLSSTLGTGARLLDSFTAVRRTTITVAATDGSPLIVTPRTILVRAGTTATMVRSKRHRGGYSLYDVDKRMFVRADVAPDHAGDPVALRLELFLKHHWTETQDVTARLKQGSRVTFAFKGRPELRGVPLRFRTLWKGDDENEPSMSTWAYGRFVR